jgi:hypothetical protein
MEGILRTRIIYGRRPGEERYFIEDREVTKAEFHKAGTRHSIKEILGRTVATQNFSRPLELDALGVHPNQVPAAMARDRRHGMAIEYTKDGTPLVKSEQEKRDYMRVVAGDGPRIFDRDAFL